MRMLLLYSLLWIGTVVQAATLSDRDRALFDAAARQYDAGHWTESRTRYEELLANGADRFEIFYNLGNACFKAGDLPCALLNYRRAGYRNPGDPELNANLRFAAEAAGVDLPRPGLPAALALKRSAAFWKTAAVVGWLLCAALLLAAAALPRPRRRLLQAAVLPGVIALLALAALRPWHTLRTEQLVTQDTIARFGPSEGSTAHFKLPAGSLVLPTGTQQNGWREISLNGQIGWVKVYALCKTKAR